MTRAFLIALICIPACGGETLKSDSDSLDTTSSATQSAGGSGTDAETGTTADTGATSDGSETTEASGTEETSESGDTGDTDNGDEIELTLMSFNIRLGGIGQSTESFVDVINAGGADIIGLQEAGTRGSDIADALGWDYDAGDLDVAYVSRYPISGSFGGGIRVTLCGDVTVTVANVHLPPYPYGPYDLRDDPSLSEAELIDGANEARGSEMTSALQGVSADLGAGLSVFMLGDFNEPSHLDWTSAAAGAGLHLSSAVAWPASQQMEMAGFADAFRTMRSDELAELGETWTSSPGANEVHDRIDFVHFVGEDLTLDAVTVVGESTDSSDVAVDPFPSDHRAIAATFRVAVPAGCAP